MYISAAVKDIHDEDRNVRTQIAHNPNTRANILAELANDMDAGIRYLVASNPSCPLDIMEQLSDDKLYAVRNAVVANPNVPDELLDKLTNDPDPNVVMKVAQKRGKSEEFLQTMPRYAIDVYDDAAAHYDGDEWMYHACDGGPAEFEENAVLLAFDSSYNSEEPSWWTDTMVTLNQMDFDCDNVHQFIEANEGYGSERELIYLFKACQTCKEQLANININTKDIIKYKFKAVQLLNPDLDLCMTEISEYNKPDHWAICIWDANYMELDEDSMRDWVFGDLYELCTYHVTDDDLANISPENFEAIDLFDIFKDYGDCLDDWTTITGTEMRELSVGDKLGNLANFMGVPRNDCVLL